jgi:hypothetical protein
MKKHAAIIAALLVTGGKYVDENTGRVAGAKAFIVLQKPGGDSYICPATSGVFCLNPINLVNNQLGLSPWSVGCAVPAPKGMSLLDRIQKYNAEGGEGDDLITGIWTVGQGDLTIEQIYDAHQCCEFT